MVKIRLARYGKHKAPAYRVVVIDSKVKRDGGYIALAGTYNPSTKQGYVFNEEVVLKYLKTGAQPTESVKNAMKKSGLWKKFLELSKTQEVSKAE
ncbi:MAG: 30S ribosomal protein S16 [Mycoplasmataceae bacterium]|nr:30S ribosomal protein S16 [Mycoplasmataceae bacterium]